MIVKEDFLNKTRGLFGLNLYEARIWTALLSRGVSTAGELSDIGNVPRSRAYDVLESLEKKGFIIMKLGKPIKYLAVDPGEVVEKVKKYVNQLTSAKIKKLDDLKGGDVLEELTALHKQGVDFIEPTDLAGAIRGRHNIYTHLESMVKGAKKSVTIMTTSKGVMRKIEALKPELNRLKKKGVNIRIAAPVTKDAEGSIKSVSKDAEVRHAKDLSARFCIIDDKDLMFMVLNDEEVHPTYDVGVWVQTPYFASAMQGMFNQQWDKMTPANKMLK
ncbi:TrmB family transcriptional regulator [Candidatus Woesearchaeota archaeon]|jgi:HTH-type transcriptional regulator, sugar sensing transcriptional regulator|nr:TrmB family transcriptional regulator [Candidatus Woesearchaeota archaeon]MBT6044847.1 TrmB family transcriptional regulator [Candidatus Woesearchaeota archaeon]